MAAPLFVLVKRADNSSWSLTAGPTDIAGATAAVTAAITAQPSTRAVVLALVKSYRGSAAVVEDATPTV